MRSLSLGSLLLLCSVNALAQEHDQHIPTFETKVDMVSVAIAIQDDDGHFVTDLTVDQFKVYEDGVEQEIVLFASGLDEPWIDLPPELKDELSGRQVVGLIMDASGSMEDDMPLVRTAAIKFLMNIPKTENLFIMDFDENIRHVSLWQPGVPLASQQLPASGAQAGFGHSLQPTCGPRNAPPASVHCDSVNC